MVGRVLWCCIIDATEHPAVCTAAAMAPGDLVVLTRRQKTPALVRP